MPIIGTSARGGTDAAGVFVCFESVPDDGDSKWSTEDHSYLPLAFIGRRLGVYRQRMLDAVDALLFIVFAVFYFVLLTLVYLSPTELSFWAGRGVLSTIQERAFDRLATERTLRVGEVDLYHVDRSFEGLDTSDDWHYWLQDVVVDGLFNKTFPQQHLRLANYYTEGGQLVKLGALRIRSLRMGGTCDAHGCDYAYTPSGLNRSDYGPMRWADCPVWARLEGAVTYYTCAGVVLDIAFSDSHDEALQAVGSLRTVAGGAGSSGGFDVMDVTTVRAVSVEYGLYLPSVDSYLLVACLAEIPLGGGIVTRTITTVIPRSVSVATWVFLGLSAGALLLIAGVLLCRHIMDASSASVARGAGHQQSRWMRAVLWWGHILLVTGHFLAMGFRIGETPSLAVDGSADGYAESLWRAVVLYRIEIHFAAICALFAVIRLLSVFHFAPLLRTVTMTMVVAFRNMLVIGLAFVILILGYAISGYFLFGDAVEGFRHCWPAVQTVVRALLGDFDYGDLRSSSPGPAGVIYYWSFMIITISICLNFLVGILGGALGKVTSDEVDGDGDAGFAGRIARAGARLWWELGLHMRLGVVDGLLQTVLLVQSAEGRRILEDAFDDGRARDAMSRLRDEGVAVRVRSGERVDAAKRRAAIYCREDDLPPQMMAVAPREGLSAASIPSSSLPLLVPMYSISPLDLYLLHERRGARQRYYGTRGYTLPWLSAPRISLDDVHYLWYGRGCGLSQQFAAHRRRHIDSLGPRSRRLRDATDGSYSDLIREVQDMSLKLRIMREWYAAEDW